MTQHVLIVGSMAFDDLELPSGQFDNVVGGSAVYASLAAGLFAQARIVAVIGEDFPRDWLKTLATHNVDTLGVEQAKGKTFRWRGRYAKDLSSRVTLDTKLNVFSDFQPKIPSNYEDSSHLLLGNIHPALQLEVLERVKAPRFVAADTMNFWIERERPTLERLLSKIDTLLINDEEVRLLGEEHNISKAAARVRALGPRRLVVKRGDAGALLFDDEGVFFSPALPLELEVDPTGAGDTFAGALLGQLAQTPNLTGASLRRALWGAAATATFCVQGVGPGRLAEVTLAEVMMRSEQIAALSQICAE